MTMKGTEPRLLLSCPPLFSDPSTDAQITRPALCPPPGLVLAVRYGNALAHHAKVSSQPVSQRTWFATKSTMSAVSAVAGSGPLSL